MHCSHYLAFVLVKCWFVCQVSSSWIKLCQVTNLPMQSSYGEFKWCVIYSHQQILKVLLVLCVFSRCVFSALFTLQAGSSLLVCLVNIMTVNDKHDRIYLDLFFLSHCGLYIHLFSNFPPKGAEKWIWGLYCSPIWHQISVWTIWKVLLTVWKRQMSKWLSCKFYFQVIGYTVVRLC